MRQQKAQNDSVRAWEERKQSNNCEWQANEKDSENKGSGKRKGSKSRSSSGKMSRNEREVSLMSSVLESSGESIVWDDSDLKNRGVLEKLEG